VNIMKTTHILVLVSLVIGLIVACSATPPQSTQSPLGPSPIAQPETAASPLPTGNATPFQMERPLAAGASVVRGTGPAGVPIFIADVTFMGEPLGTGIIGPDGKFSVLVKALPDGHRIGLALGVLDGTGWKPQDFYQQEYNGPDAMQIPQVGFFHDTAMVGKK
jgi:hypothetical protein